MPLTIGTRLGSYEVLASIGAGGMGEVYRAHDHTLGRDVALKILPEVFARDPDRAARFEREARALAALNHPHIAQVFGLEASGDVRAIAMELVEGPTLDQVIAHARAAPGGLRTGSSRGLPLREALRIARQIADALEAAHEAGIIHRDLKPANIKVKDDGIVKVLDFGLARSFDSPAGRPGLREASDPTVISGLPASDATTMVGPAQSPAVTAYGVILGTAAYMAPEQAQGKSVDRRADAWAFGVVLYEMLTGRRAFEGQSVSDVLNAVITQQLPLSELPADTPEPIRRLLRRCLEKNRRDRLADLSTARLEIDDALTAGPTPPTAVAPTWHKWMTPGSLIVLAAAIVAIVVARPWSSPPAAPPVRSTTVEIRPPADLMFTNIYGAGDVSPDGHSVIFGAGTGVGSASRSLWIRSLATADARPIEGSERGQQPIWSPDGRDIVFWSDGKLRRVQLSGGAPPRVLCDIQKIPWSGAWSTRGFLIVGSFQGLLRVPENGGTPTPLTAVDPGRRERAHGFPQILPDGRVLYFVASDDPEVEGVYVAGVDFNGPPIRVLKSPSKAVYVPALNADDGHLIWAEGTALLAQRIRVDSLTLEGAPATVMSGIATIPDRKAFWASAGTLSFFLGDDLGPKNMTWFDRDGRQLGDAAPVGLYRTLRISRDGSRAGVVRTVNADISAWVLELSRGTWTHVGGERLNLAGPFWSPGDRELAFGWAGTFQRRNASGLGPVQPLVTGDVRDWSADGRFVLVARSTPETQSDLFVRSIEQDAVSTTVSATRFREENGRFSPDGKWVAYTSDESGRFEVYVQAVTGAERRWQVSIDGGELPVWRRDGQELLFVGPRNDTILAASVRATKTTIDVGRPTLLFTTPAPLMAGSMSGYDVAPDGRLLILTGESRGPAVLTVLLNWQARLPQ